MTAKAKSQGEIRVGVGGWTFEPWRGVFYPKGLPQKRELEYASRQLTSIEINGTYHGTQKPESFVKWREETPGDFIFTVKGPRFATNRRVLAEAGESISRFFASGVLELGDKLGPINWQFATTKKFDREDFSRFLALLPKRIGDREIRHAVEVRHDSFRDGGFVELAREHDVAIVVAGQCEFPLIADVTTSFVYVRIMGASDAHESGYAAADLDKWALRARAWAAGITGYAHHSFGATYDTNKQVKLSGKLTQFVYRHPHSFVNIDVTDESGQLQHWSLEWGGTAQLANAGVKRDSLKLGDDVRIVANPSRAKSVLGWSPTMSDLTSIIQSAWDWRKKYPHGYKSLANTR